MLAHAAQLWMALAIDAIVGYPSALYRRVRHPVVWMGALIERLEAHWNRGSFARRRVLGCLLMACLIGITGLVAWTIELAATHASSFATVLAAVIASSALAQRSLDQHVSAVAQALLSNDLRAARAAVSKIVGRDTATLDASGVTTAAIESLAESFCDGVVAPAFWLLIGGLPGVFIYKAINTADSLIGHKDSRCHAFGWSAARTDDAMNLIPARIAGVLLCMAGGRGVRTMWRDAPRHASPNAGWTEAAMAGVLRRELGGVVSYEGVTTTRPLFGAGPRPATQDLVQALRVYRRACLLLWLLIGALAWPW